MKASDAVDISQGIEHEVLIILHVPGIHLDLEIVITGGVVAFRYLVFCRSKVGEGERCTLAASSFTVSREFCCNNFSILMSISSRFSSVAIVPFLSVL